MLTHFKISKKLGELFPFNIFVIALYPIPLCLWMFADSSSGEPDILPFFPR